MTERRINGEKTQTEWLLRLSVKFVRVAEERIARRRVLKNNNTKKTKKKMAHGKTEMQQGARGDVKKNEETETTQGRPLHLLLKSSSSSSPPPPLRLLSVPLLLLSLSSSRSSSGEL